MGGLRRRASPSSFQEAAVDGVIPMADEVFAKKYPLLSEFLTRVLWEPDQPREKGSFFVFYEHGVFKACVNDKDSLQVAFVSSVTFTGLFDAIEKGLAKDSLDWRVSTQGKQAKRK